MPSDALPSVSAIVSDEDPTAWTAAVAAPSFDIDLPSPCEESIRVLRIHRQIGRACVLVDEEHALPGLSTIFRAEDAALRLRAIARAERRHKDDVRIMRIDDDSSNTSGGIEAHVLPRLPRICGLVHTVADGHVAANERLARTNPHDAVVRRGDCNRPDRLRRFFIEDGMPIESAIGGLPYSSRSRTGVINVCISRFS